MSARILLTAALLALAMTATAAETNWPNYREDDFIVKNYGFKSGESLPEVKIHYRTLGTPKRDGNGNIANAVLGALGRSKDIPAFEMYTEVLQDSAVPLLENDRCRFASTCSLTLSPEAICAMVDDLIDAHGDAIDERIRAGSRRSVSPA